MEEINVPLIHDKILKFFLTQRDRNRDFTFTLRKSDFSKRLTNGYWFHGNDNYIAISFWNGMDWQSKVPNIALIIIPSTGKCFIQFSAKDSPEKDELILTFFKEQFQLEEISRAFYTGPIFSEVDDYMLTIENFLNKEKIFIDNIIKKNKRIFDTKQNSKNRISFISGEDFEKNLKRTRKVQRRNRSSNLPIGLLEIEIEDFGLIKKLLISDIPPDAQWIFFTGENGSGKTTILKAIATALTNSTIRLGPKTSVRGDFSIGLNLQKDGKKSRRYRIKKNIPSSISKLDILSKGLVCLGPVRLNVQESVFSLAGVAKSKAVLNTFEKPHLPLFNTVNPLIDIGYVYNRNSQISQELKDNQEKLKFIIEAITSICDKIVDIQFSKAMRYFEVDSDRNMISDSGTPFHNLASGYKSIIAMVSHMMLHLYYQQPDVNDPSLLEGIVIIDEIDLHFHPRMQRDLIIKLTEIFPRIQFIASTHSPIPLLGVPENTPIFTSKIDAEKGIFLERMNNDGEISDLLPNALLTSPIFNLQEIIPESHDSRELLNTDDDYSDVVFYKMLDEKLSSIKKKYNND